MDEPTVDIDRDQPTGRFIGGLKPGLGVETSYYGKRQCCLLLSLRLLLTPVAGLIFETKNREIFLERFFWREITAREQVSRAVILEKFQVIQ